MIDYYSPIFRNQIGDPTTTRDGFICTMSAGAMALDYHTLGAIQRWGGELEAHQSDHVGGTDLYDLADAWRYYGQTLLQGTGGWAGVKAALALGRAVVVQGDYDRIPTAFSCQPGFNDLHAEVLIPSLVSWASIGDPLCRAFKSIPEAYLKAYAEKLSTNVRFAVSAAHLALNGGWSIRIAPGAQIKLVKTFGTNGCVATWESRPNWGPTASSAPCKEPVYRKGCVSGGTIIALVTKGTFVNRWIRIGAGVSAVEV